MLNYLVFNPVFYNDVGKSKEKIDNHWRVSQNMMAVCYYWLKYNCYF